MADFAVFADLLLRGAESARRDARRIVEELRERGELSEDEAEALQAAAERAAAAGSGLIRDALASPLRRALSTLRAAADTGPAGPDPGDALERRLASLDERIARIEARLDALAGGAGPGARQGG